MSNQNHKKRTFRIAIFFIVLAIVLPVSGYYLGSRGFLMPENEIGKTNLKPVASGLTVEYDLTSGVTAGTKIKRMETVSVPEGIQVTTEEGMVTVGIADKGMKAGTYKIKVNIYFEGAQAVRGYGDGKPVTKTITVKVVE